MKLWKHGVKWGMSVEKDLASGRPLEVVIKKDFFPTDNHPQLVCVTAYRGNHSVCWVFAKDATDEELKELGETLLTLCEMKRKVK